MLHWPQYLSGTVSLFDSCSSVTTKHIANLTVKKNQNMYNSWFFCLRFLRRVPGSTQFQVRDGSNLRLIQKGTLVDVVRKTKKIIYSWILNAIDYSFLWINTTDTLSPGHTGFWLLHISFDLSLSIHLHRSITVFLAFLMIFSPQHYILKYYIRKEKYDVFVFSFLCVIACLMSFNCNINSKWKTIIISTSKEPVCPRVELILKIIIILLIIFLGFIKSKPC